MRTWFWYLAEPGDDAAGMAAGDAEDHLDPGLLQDPRDQHPRRRLLLSIRSIVIALSSLGIS